MIYPQLPEQSALAPQINQELEMTQEKLSKETALKEKEEAMQELINSQQTITKTMEQLTKDLTAQTDLKDKAVQDPNDKKEELANFKQ